MWWGEAADEPVCENARPARRKRQHFRGLKPAEQTATLRAVNANALRPFLLVALVVLLLGCRQQSEEGGVSGTIETDEVRVASRYGGRVESITASEGEALTTGQVLVRLEADELVARRAQAAARLADAEAGARPQELAAAKAEWEAQAAQWNLARLERKRADELFAAKTISEIERDRALTTEQALEKTVAAAQSRHELLLAGTRPDQIALARAQVAELDTQLRERTIVAPTNCVLEVLHVKSGDVLTANQPVATLLLTNRLWVRVFVPEPWLGHIAVGDEVSVSVDSFPGSSFAGTVEQIARAAEFTPRNVQTVGERVKQVFGVKIRLNNTDGRLRAGMAADVIFTKLPK